MKIVFIILGVVLCLLLLLCFLSLTVDLKFCGELILKIKYSGITFFDSEKKVKVKKSKKGKKQAKEKSQDNAPKKENFFKKTYKQKGLLAAIRYFSEIFILLLKKLCWVIKHFKFRKVYLELSVAAPDAADTALNYGRVCSAVYPVLSFLQSNADFKAKNININADFDKTESKLELSFSVTTKLFFWVVAAMSALFEYLKLQHKESENNERK